MVSPGSMTLVAYTPMPFPGLGRASHNRGGPRQDWSLKINEDSLQLIAGHASATNISVTIFSIIK